MRIDRPNTSFISSSPLGLPSLLVFLFLFSSHLYPCVLVFSVLNNLSFK